MMKKGVMTVYFSLVFMLVMSFLLVLLESDRLYILRTEGERYADMAAEMVFAGYIQPLADYYSLFGVNHGEKNSQLEKFDDYLKLNITGEGKTKRLFQMAGAIEEVEVDEWTGFKDNDWKALMEQVKLYEEARTIQRGREEVSRFFSDLSGMDTDEPVGDYCRQLESKGERMEAEEQEANKKDDGNTPKDTEIQMEDPRGGITRWLKGGLLELVMGDQAVSKQKISTARCSWQTSEEKKSNVIVRFDRYKEVAEAVKGQNLLTPVAAGGPGARPAGGTRPHPVHLLRLRQRRHRGRQQGGRQDRERQDRRLRAGILVVRLQEVGRPHDHLPAPGPRPH